MLDFFVSVYTLFVSEGVDGQVKGHEVGIYENSDHLEWEGEENVLLYMLVWVFQCIRVDLYIDYKYESKVESKVRRQIPTVSRALLDSRRKRQR